MSNAPVVTLVSALSAASVDWAMGHLASMLGQHGIAAQRARTPPESAHGPIVLAAAPDDARINPALGAGQRQTLALAESLALLPATSDGKPVILATGGDSRGITYALLELADRVQCAPHHEARLAALSSPAPEISRPANRIRSILRTFSSDVADLPWFRDKAFWHSYLTELATQRFNRFELALGIGYDFAQQMRDSYFYFAYPFLLPVAGYEVRARGLPDSERDENLAMLRFIAAETKRRGLHFQLGLWAQIYEFQDSPQVNYPITGVTPENHAPYCRDALAALLAAVPEIDGLTLRVHGESGIPEGAYDFWQVLFSAVANCGRRLELDLHSKGIDKRKIEMALATGQPVVISPKYWAEHLGLPYHQTDIRPDERPGKATGEHAVLMALSTGERRFTRYGYADLLREDRQYGVLFRMWPGTQRVLLWGDLAAGRAYSRAMHFCGADGAEIFEPLSFSGRRGSGLATGRDPYLDPALRPAGANADWQKYRYTYRLWGRLLYDPEADAEAVRRFLRHELGAAGADAERALASASRILPLVITAHLPSAANNRYWPEIHSSLPIVEGVPHYYTDMAKPWRFGNASPLDSQAFSSPEQYVDELISGRLSGRYGPPDVAAMLDRCSAEALRAIAAAESRGDGRPALRRLAIDVRMEAALGTFWAHKLRAAVHYTLFRRIGDRPSLEKGIAAYRLGREAFASAAALAQGVYRPDLAFGPEEFLRGHWSDRLAGIDADLAAMAAEVLSAPAGASAEVPPLATRPEGTLIHTPAAGFAPGEAVALEFAVPAGVEVASMVLHHRPVTQAERFATVALDRADGRWRGTVPASATAGPYPLQYFVEVHERSGAAWRWPGIGLNLDQQPYVVIRTRGRGPG